jgi:hypothetical protein
LACSAEMGMASSGGLHPHRSNPERGSHIDARVIAPRRRRSGIVATLRMQVAS